MNHPRRIVCRGGRRNEAIVTNEAQTLFLPMRNDGSYHHYDRRLQQVVEPELINEAYSRTDKEEDGKPVYIYMGILHEEES
jgi:hypothetical protein